MAVAVATIVPTGLEQRKQSWMSTICAHTQRLAREYSNLDEPCTVFNSTYNAQVPADRQLRLMPKLTADRWEAELSRLGPQVTTLIGERDDLRTQLIRLQTIYKTTSDDHAQAMIDLRAAVDERDQARSDRDAATLAQQNAENRRDTAEDHYGNSLQQCADLSDEKSHLEQELHDRTQELDNMTRERDDHKQYRIDYEARYDDLPRVRSDLARLNKEKALVVLTWVINFLAISWLIGHHSTAFMASVAHRQSTCSADLVSCNTRLETCLVDMVDCKKEHSLTRQQLSRKQRDYDAVLSQRFMNEKTYEEQVTMMTQAVTKCREESAQNLTALQAKCTARETELEGKVKDTKLAYGNCIKDLHESNESLHETRADLKQEKGLHAKCWITFDERRRQSLRIFNLYASTVKECGKSLSDCNCSATFTVGSEFLTHGDWDWNSADALTRNMEPKAGMLETVKETIFGAVDPISGLPTVGLW